MLTEDNTGKAAQEKATQQEQEEKKPSLNELVKESHNEKAAEIMLQIDELRKKHGKLLGTARRAKRMLAYREEEMVALDKMVNASETKEANSRVVYLKRLKKRLEFKISTEATSLSAERELVKKINEVNTQLDKALAPLRMGRRLEMAKQDAERRKEEMTSSAKELAETDTKLDELYAELRKTLGIAGERKQRVHRPAKSQNSAPEINLEDIAVIKKVEKKQ